jgi:perosamine synthetase
MLVTNNTDHFQHASILHDHGRDPKIDKVFWAEKIGFKYKMSNLQAALGVAQLERVDELVDRKIDIFNLYYDQLKTIDKVVFNAHQPYVKNAFWMPTIILETMAQRDGLMRHLKQNNVDARPFFYPVSVFPEFKQSVQNPVSIKLSDCGMNLPSAFDLTAEDITYICNLIRQYLD